MYMYGRLSRGKRKKVEESRKWHQIQPEDGDEQADAGRDCRTRLAKPHDQALTGTGEETIFPVHLTSSRIGNHAYRLISNLRPGALYLRIYT